jgi:ParB family chromosome partitioning protein
MVEKRRGLGRGLGALIASGPVDPKTEERSDEKVGDGAQARIGSGDSVNSKAGTKGHAEKPKKASTAKAKPASKARSAGGKSTNATKTPSGASTSTSKSKKIESAPVEAARKPRPSDMFFTSTVPKEDSEGTSDSRRTEAKKLDATQRRSVPDVLGESRRRRGSADSSSRQSSASSASGSSPEGLAPSASESSGEGSDLVAVPGTTFAEVAIDDIHPNRKQPRQVFDEDELDELVTSIREVGLLQPIVVRVSRETSGPKYELVMGERRWRASQAAGLTRIPAIVRETDDADLLRDALLENLHRSQLNPLEEAAAYQQLMDEFACTQDELSERIGRSRPQISNTIRLLRLPALVQRRVAAGVLSAGHARALLTVEDAEQLERLAQRVVNEGLSVRATEEAAALLRGEKPSSQRRRKAEPQRHERLDHLASSLQDRLDTNVKITLGARKGKVQIDFASVEDLERIMDLIGSEQ